jgi:hypothetical protein
VDEGPVELTDPAHGAVELDGRGGGRVEAEIIWDDEPAGASALQDTAPSPRVAPEDLAAAEIDAARRAESAASDREEGRRAPDRGAGDAPARTGRTGPEGRAATAAPGARARRDSVGGPGAARPARPRRTPAGAPTPAPAVIEVRPRSRRGPRIGLIFVLLILMVATTVGWRAWRLRRQQLPRVIERGRVEGIPALDEGEFDRAHQLLSAAKAALDTLGGGDEDAEEIRHAAKEAAIFVDLCPDKLEDMLAEAGRTDPDAWSSKFDTHYKGRSYLFDTIIESTPEESDTGAYQIAYVVFPPGEASRFGEGGLPRPDRFARIDLAGFELLEQNRLVKDARVTFGARLRAIVYDSEQKQWVVRLEPESGVFIKHYRALQASGWPAVETAEVPREDMP